MFRLFAFSFLALFAVQSYGLEDPSPSKKAEYRNLVADWSEAAKRMVRSLENRPQEDAEWVSAQLDAALSEGRRPKREAPSTPSGSGDQLQDLLKTFNEGLKSVMSNVTSSSLYQEMSKIGENLNSKGKELVGQLQEQVKNFQMKTKK